MRILQICSARSIGGGERHVIDLSNALANRGHDIFLAIAPGSPLHSNLNRIPSQNIVELSLRNSLDLKSAFRIGTFAKRDGIDIINAHLARDYPIAAIAARISRVPFVITRHVLFPMNRLHKRFLRDVRCVIAPSNAVAANLKRESIFPTEKIETIRYGIDVSKFPEPVRQSKPAALTVGAIGNLDPVKGFDVFIRAAAIVKEKFPDVRFRIIGGDNSAGGRNEKELRSLIRELRLEEYIEMSGWTNDIAAAFQDLDVFVSASRSESFGFVIAEAMLCRVPVVATEAEGSKEIVADDSLGRLVAIDATNDLAEAIASFLADPDERARLASNGREYITRHFSLERMVSDTEALYRRVSEAQ